MNRFRLGTIEVARIVECERPEFTPESMFAEATPEALAPYRSWLEPHALDPVSGRLILPVQSYLLRTRHHNILVDACLGEGKTCRWYEPWHKLRGLTFLADLARLGLAPRDIDYVMCTHLHGDHVGWNTRLVDGSWVPTFPKARYVMSRIEIEHWQAYNWTATPETFEDCIEESVLPIVAAGRAVYVEDGLALDDEVRIEPLPGHTPGHYGVRLDSGGEGGIMIGDLMHSPVQCAEPDWGASDGDPALARATRRRFLESHADTDTLVLTAHFPSPSVGHIRRVGAAYRFKYGA